LKRKKVMAVSSPGGHWVQLLRTSPAFWGHDVHWISTDRGLASKVPCGTFAAVRDATMGEKLGLLVMAFQIALQVIRFKPDVVITTGSAPGYFAIMCGRFFRSRTIWIDSIANAEELSLSGQNARAWADYWLTQWPELARENGPHYLGAIL